MSRKICYQELFEKFETQAKQLLGDIPEARGLILVVDWEVGNMEFPPCHLVTRESPTQQSTLEMMKQGVRLLELLADLQRKQLQQTEIQCRQLEAYIRKARAEDSLSS